MEFVIIYYNTIKRLKQAFWYININMKRAVLCVDNPQHFIPQLKDHSIMIINPNAPEARNRYLLDNSDWSLYITKDQEKVRNGNDYPNERVLWYTSGTTGDSKFCSFTQAQLNNMAATIMRSYNLSANDRYTSIMSLWHAHGQGFYWATQLAGCETTYITMKDIKTFPSTNPTFITAIPDVLRVVAELDFDNLRFIRSASSPLPPDLYNKLSAKFNVPIVEAFGMTEAMSHCFTNPLDGQQRVGTVGLPDGIEAKIDNGNLMIKGFNVCDEDWYDTGDLAEQDEMGYYRILGRSRDQINVKGSKINPISIERQLLQHIPGMKGCVIFGTDQVKCLYVGTCDEIFIKNFLVSLGKHCKATVLKQVDAIPLSPAGKISRALLNSCH
jgi:acyl-coenzyme A synthetase/AMP-(fatty) acid ligase